MDYLTLEALREKTTYIAVMVTHCGEDVRVPVVGTPEDRRHLGVLFNDAGLKHGFFVSASEDVSPIMTVGELEDKFLSWWRGQHSFEKKSLGSVIFSQKCGDREEVAR